MHLVYLNMYLFKSDMHGKIVKICIDSYKMHLGLSIELSTLLWVNTIVSLLYLESKYSKPLTRSNQLLLWVPTSICCSKLPNPSRVSVIPLKIRIKIGKTCILLTCHCFISSINISLQFVNFLASVTRIFLSVWVINGRSSGTNVIIFP